MKEDWHDPCEFWAPLDFHYTEPTEHDKQIVKQFIYNHPELFGDDNWHLPDFDVLNNTPD